MIEHLKNQRGAWRWVVDAWRQRDWWQVVDNLLHLAEAYIPDRILEIQHWRVRFCTWCTVRYDKCDEWKK